MPVFAYRSITASGAVVESRIDALSEAHARTQLRAKSGYEAELSFNRLLRMRDGTDQFGWDGDPREVAGVAGPIDPEMAVLGIYDQESNLRGMLINFALAIGVSRFTKPPPEEVQRLVEEIRLPRQETPTGG